MSEELVTQLKELGVSERTARYALDRFNNDVGKAADYGPPSPPLRHHSFVNPWADHICYINISNIHMAPLDRSFSLPISITNSVSRLKVFSGDASKDEESQASDLILGALDRDRGRSSRSTFLGLGRSNSPGTPPRSSPEETKSIIQPSKPIGANKGSSKYRTPSPFFRARRSREKARARDTSPEVGPLVKDVESDVESVGTGPRKFRPQASAYDEDSDSEEPFTDGDEDEDDDELIEFDEETEKNTEANAVFLESEPEEEERAVLDTFGEEIEQDIHGEGPNVVVAPQPAFPTSNFAPKRRKSLRSTLELTTSRPTFARDRCTMTITHGNPDAALEQSGKRMRRYVVLSDLSDESRYAVEWAIGTVARDGDEIFLISVKEDESKVDPKSWSDADKGQKLKIQRERQQTTLQLCKQVTSLLQRTRLNITVTCQFLHAKNARHMLLDLIDFLEPTMAIVGSRGLGQLKGILLGSTSHYLVQKSSVPVMVARRRLQRPLRKTDPKNLRHSPRVSLASASIEKTASSKQEDEVVDVAETEAREIKAERMKAVNEEEPAT